MRLAPYIAARSQLSRRQAERAIIQGRVRVDGVVWRDFCISPGHSISVDDCVLDALPSVRLWSYSKPRGQLVTRHDPQGRPTVFDQLRTFIPQGPLVTVGRLDYDSEGLLLVSNAPLLAHVLETTGLKRCYTVHVYGALREKELDHIRRGRTYEGVHYRPCTLSVQKNRGMISVLRITLNEGKKREIRRLMHSAGLDVQRLIRHSFGPFSLPEGQIPGTVQALDPFFLKNDPVFQRALNRPNQKRAIDKMHF